MTAGIQRLSFNEEWKLFIDSEQEHIERDPLGWLRWAVRHHAGRNKVWICRLVNIAEETLMARGKGQGAERGETRSQNWTDFVDIPVTTEDYAAMLEMAQGADDVVDEMAGMLEKGYRFSFTYNVQNDATICSLTCKDEESVNSGCTMTAFAGSWYDALQLALYKHRVIAEGDWRAAAKSRKGARFG